MSEFKTIIGLEIHAQLNTKSKMFCFCDNDSEGKAPNTVICPICLGLPGTLPVANEQAIIKTIQIGKALGCDIPEVSKFDRKHYYYPDLPKGYQISQYDMPLCKGGTVEFDCDGVEVSVELNRIHLEEDAGKLTHDNISNNTIVDLNRAGTPLVEIVTEPVMHEPAHARVFMQTLQKVLRQLGVSSADMEKGHMRCDANISVVRDGVSSKIIEVKNLNSSRFVQKALEYEQERLTKEFDKNIGPGKETRGFDSKLSKTVAQRKKEEASDYRYFPEPDIPSIFTHQIKIEEANLELPENFRKRIEKDFSLASQVASKIASDGKMAMLFKSIEAEEGININRIANWLVNEKLPDFDGPLLVKLSGLVDEGTISNDQARQIMRSDAPDNLIVRFARDADDLDVGAIVDKVISEHPDEKAKYQAGKKQLIGYFVGMAVKVSGGSADPQRILQEFKKRLEK